MAVVRPRPPDADVPSRRPASIAPRAGRRAARPVGVDESRTDARRAAPEQGSHARILALVRRIPRGRVATYGQIASLADLPGHARLVGYALAALPSATAVPWHRVVNAQGRVSARAAGAGASVTQRLLLEREGVRFDAAGRLDLDAYRWVPRRTR